MLNTLIFSCIIGIYSLNGMAITSTDINNNLKYEKNIYKDCNMPINNSFKSYMSFKTITNRNSKQYELQKLAYTDNSTGIRMIDDNYCIAVGTGVGASVGDRISVIMGNGEHINCVVADIKADIHTKSDNIQTIADNSVIEFIVDVKQVPTLAKKMGDMSYVNYRFEGEIEKIRVYK